MKFTCIIGNGFDIALGLNTRYTDYIAFLVNELNAFLHPARPGVSEKSRAYASWLLGIVKEHKQEFWSNAELAFGAIPFSSGGGDVADVAKFAHDRFQGCMQRWLTKEMGRIEWDRIDKEDVSSVFIINCTTGWMRHVLNGGLAQFLEHDSVTGIELNIINFNYTDVIEKLIEPRIDSEFTFAHFSHKVNVRIGDICHIHGLCAENSPANALIFGVNDPDQITDIKAKENYEVRARLNKQEYQKGYFNGTIMRNAERLLSKSDYICTYGLSFGATDKYWWERIFEYIRNPSKHLVVCPYTTNREDIAQANDVIRYKQSIVRRVFSSLGEDAIQDVLKADVIAQIVGVKPADIETLDGGRAICDYFQLGSIGHELGLL